MSTSNEINLDRPKSPAKKKGLPIWDILSIGVLFATACIGSYFVIVFISPNIFINPFAPALQETLIPTFTITPLVLPATWTPTETPYIPPTDTPRPTFTPVFTITPVLLVPPTATAKPTATPKAPYGAKVDNISSGLYHPEAGCNWLGVAGVVLDKNKAHHLYLTVILSGTLNGQTINQITVSGAAAQSYGASGFEFYLGAIPLDSKGTLYLQLRDQGNVPLSENVYINTSKECSKNLVWVQFKENP
jgi:hypothetical protein